jgi:hypothetical protein
MSAGGPLPAAGHRRKSRSMATISASPNSNGYWTSKPPNWIFSNEPFAP